MDLKETHYSSYTRHPWELARLDIVRHFLKGSGVTGKTHINIADVGCGDVFFLSKMNEDYPQATLFGVDIAFTDEIQSKIHKEYPALDVKLEKDIADVPLDEKNPADLVFLLDVIEHIEDDKGFLKNLLAQPYITPDTIIVITVPAFQRLYTSHDDILGHYRRYTNDSLLQVVHEAGLEHKDYGFFFTSLVLARLAEVFFEKLSGGKKQKTDVGSWNRGRRITKIIRAILLFDFYVSRFFRILGIRLPGLSNYAVCRKRV